MTPQPTRTSTLAVGGLTSDSSDDKPLFQILWRRRWIVIACIAMAMLVSVSYLLLAHPTYTAVSRLFIEAAGGKKAGQDAADRTAFLYTQREVITSTPVLATALGGPGILDFETFAKERDAITALRNTLSVDVGKKDELVSVSLESAYPNEATQIVAAVVAAYSRFQVIQRTALTSELLTTLEAENTSTNREIAERTKALQAFSLEHNIVGTDASTSNDDQSLRAIAASLTQAHLDTLAVTSRLSAMPASAGAANAATAPGTELSAEDEAAVTQQLLNAETSLSAIISKYPASSPPVRAARTQIEQLKRQRYSILEAIKRAAVRHEADLRSYYDAEQRHYIEQRAFAAEYTRLSGEMKRLQERADAVDTRLRDLKVNDEGKMANVSILEPAHTDPASTGPKRFRVLGIALAAGLILGLFAALACDQFDRRFESISETERWLGLATLGILPTMPTTGTPIGRALYLFSEPTSAFAHACQSILTTVDALCHGAPIKTLSITSPSREDGRTTAACGLGIAMAQHGHRVLLIDADGVSPNLASMLGVEAVAGLANLYNATVIDAALVRSCVTQTIVPNLHLIAGSKMTSVDRPNLPAVLEAAAREFDVVIVDTPAAHKNADARVIAANCQATLMVVRLGHTDSFAAGRVRNDLYNVGANVLGVVLNRANSRIGVGATTMSVTSAAQAAALSDGRDTRGLPPAEIGSHDSRPADQLSLK